MKPKNLKEAEQKATGNGREPAWGEKNDGTISSALTWYNYFSDLKDAKKYTIKYLVDNKFDPEKVKAVQSLTDWHFITIGYVCRIKERGAPISPVQNAWINRKLGELFVAATGKDEEVIDENGVTLHVITVQQRVEQICQEYIGEMEIIIDNSIIAKDFTFKAYDWMYKNMVKPMHAKVISKYYSGLLSEVTEALSTSDEQLIEGYKFLTKAQLTKYHTMIKGIIDDADRIVHNGKSQRVPKKKKAPTADKIISKLIYKKEDIEYKLKSINPIDIIGAKQLWVFNAKTRKLGVYYSFTGFTVSGTTIKDFDETTSIQKNVRRPLETLPGIISGLKTEVKIVMNSLNSTPVQLTGRINADTILLRIIK